MKTYEEIKNLKKVNILAIIKANVIVTIVYNCTFCLLCNLRWIPLKIINIKANIVT